MFKKQIKQLEERIIRGLDQTETPQFFSFEFFLLCMAFLYGLIVKFRLFLYKNKVFSAQHLPCPVISVGNMVVGGAGKTPMAIHLAQCLVKMGRKPVVVSRGYKGTYTQTSLIVSDGQSIMCTADVCGDEPFMMARRNAFPVVVGKSRLAAGRRAVKELGCDVVILDDGFQHLNLGRDIDFLLMDWVSPLGNNRFLPAGRLRETFEMAMPRASALIFTRCPEGQDNNMAIPIPLNTMSCPLFFSSHSPFVLTRLSRLGERMDCNGGLELFKGRTALLFSGIASNRSFYKTVRDAGINIVAHLEFKDHYGYKGSDIEMINKTAVGKNAEFILTTEKDWVKLDSAIEWPKDVIVVGIKIQFHDPEGFDTFLRAKLKSI